MDRSLIRVLLILLALAMAVLWLFAVIAAFAVPSWAPAAALLALAVACLL